jgi:hypothetical protein
MATAKATAVDALAAANAATARIDTMETQLDNIAQQLQVLIAAAGGGGGGGGGGGLVVQRTAYGYHNYGRGVTDGMIFAN